MKKLISLFAAVVLSTTFALADGGSCQVRSTRNPVDGNVVLSYENAQSGSNGQVCTQLYFSGDRGNNAASNTISVLVKCYDASTDRLVGTKSITVRMDGVPVYACFNVQADSAYYFRLSDAHCG